MTGEDILSAAALARPEQHTEIEGVDGAPDPGAIARDREVELPSPHPTDPPAGKRFAQEAPIRGWERADEVRGSNCGAAAALAAKRKRSAFCPGCELKWETAGGDLVRHRVEHFVGVARVVVEADESPDIGEARDR